MNSQQEQFFSLCDRLKHILGERSERYKALWLLKDQKGKARLERMLIMKAIKEFGTADFTSKVFLPPLPDKNIDKDNQMKLGSLDKKKPFITDPETLLRRHVIVGGSSGFGKSTFIWKLLQELFRLQKEKHLDAKCVLFDWKGDYVSLIKSGFDKELLVFRPGDTGKLIFPFNPLYQTVVLGMKPNGVIDFSVADQLIDLICVRWLGGLGVRRYLKRGLRDIVQKWQDNNYSAEHTPCLNKLLHWIVELEVGRQGRGRSSQRSVEWRESAERSLDELTMTEFGQRLCCNQDEHISYNILSNFNILFLMENISQDSYKQFFIEAIFLVNKAFRMEQQKRSRKGGLRQIFFIDESWNVLQTDNEGNEPIILQSMRSTRSLGCSLVLIDQLPGILPKTVWGNSGSKFCFNTDTDTAKVGKALGLITKEQSDYLTRLDIGQAVCRMKALHPKPFLLEAEIMDNFMLKEVNDFELEAYMKPLWEKLGRNVPIPAVPASSQRLFNAESPEQPAKKPDKIYTLSELSILERAFIKYVCENPFNGLTKIWKLMKISKRNGTKIKESLEQKGLIAINEVLNGRVVKLSKLSEQGKRIAGELGCLIRRLQGEGSLEHEYYRDKRKRYWQAKGYDTIFEKNGADIVVVGNNGTAIIDEIYTGKSPINWNNMRRLMKKYQHIYFTPTSSAARAQLNEELKDMDLLDSKRITVVAA